MVLIKTAVISLIVKWYYVLYWILTEYVVLNWYSISMLLDLVNVIIFFKPPFTAYASKYSI